MVFKWLTWDDPSHGRVATTQIKKDDLNGGGAVGVGSGVGIGDDGDDVGGGGGIKWFSSVGGESGGFKWLTWDDPSHGRVATTQIKKDGRRAKTATRFVKIPRDTFHPIFYQGASFLGCLKHSSSVAD